VIAPHFKKYTSVSRYIVVAVLLCICGASINLCAAPPAKYQRQKQKPASPVQRQQQRQKPQRQPQQQSPVHKKHPSPEEIRLQNARKGDVQAQYEEGMAWIDKNNVSAKDWLKKAADQGHIDAAFEYAKLLTAENSTSNYDDIEQYSSMALLAGKKEALQLLMQVRDKVDASISTADYARKTEVYEHYKSFADRGDYDAAFRVARYLENAYTHSQASDACRYYQNAESMGYPGAEEGLDRIKRSFCFVFTDKKTNKPLPYVHVKVAGRDNEYIADDRGNIIISDLHEGNVLYFSYNGGGESGEVLNAIPIEFTLMRAVAGPLQYAIRMETTSKPKKNKVNKLKYK